MAQPGEYDIVFEETCVARFVLPDRLAVNSDRKVRTLQGSAGRYAGRRQDAGCLDRSGRYEIRSGGVEDSSGRSAGRGVRGRFGIS